MHASDHNNLNFFSLLQIQETAEPDFHELETAYQQLQGKFHPDNFAASDVSLRLDAVQKTSLLNDAYTTLKNPVKRAAYLLQLRGVDPNQHEQGELRPDFLLQQIQLREQLESCTSAADAECLAKMAEDAEQAFSQYWSEFKQQFEAGVTGGAKAAFHKLQFAAKLQDEIYEEEARLFD